MVGFWVMRWGRVVWLRGMMGLHWAVWGIRLGWCMGLVPILGSRCVAVRWWSSIWWWGRAVAIHWSWVMGRMRGIWGRGWAIVGGWAGAIVRGRAWLIGSWFWLVGSWAVFLVNRRMIWGRVVLQWEWLWGRFGGSQGAACQG